MCVHSDKLIYCYIHIIFLFKFTFIILSVSFSPKDYLKEKLEDCLLFFFVISHI